MKSLYVAMLFSALVMSGCYTPHFLPNTVPVPMFDKAGNVRLAGYAGTNSYDVHVGVSPVEYIGILGAGSYSRNKKVDTKDNNEKPDDEAEYTHGHRYYEGALVVYFSPGTIKNDILKLEILAGYGKGTANGSIDTGKKDFLGFTVPTNHVNADYQQYYIQLNAGFNNVEVNRDTQERSGGSLEYGSVFRFSKTRYSNFEKDSQPIKIDPMEGTFIQAGLFASIGGSGSGVTFQAGWLYPIADDVNRPSYSPLFIAAGLRIGLW